MPPIHASLPANPHLPLPEASVQALARLYDNNGTARNRQDLARLREFSAQAFSDPGAWRSHRLGAGPHGTVDVFLPRATGPAPALLFVHGGRWRLNTSRETAFWAQAATAAGCGFVGLNFPKLGEASLTDMVAAVRDGIAAVFDAAPHLGLDARRLALAGHSSGAQLALAAALDLPRRAPAGAPWLAQLRALYLLGGMYDLRPLALCTPAAALGFDAAEAEAMSPVLALAGAAPRLPPTLVGVGGEESPEFMRQAQALHWELRRAGGAAWQSIAGAAHFDAALEFNRAPSQARAFVCEALAIREPA